MRLARRLFSLLNGSLRWQLMALMTSATVGPTLLLLIGGYWLFSAYAIPQRQEFLSELSHEYDERMLDHLAMRLDEVSAIARDLGKDVASIDHRRLVDELGDHSSFAELKLVRPDGSLLASSHGNGDEGVHEGLIKRALEHEAALGRLLEDPDEGGLVVPVVAVVPGATQEAPRLLLAKLLWSDLFGIVQDTARDASDGALNRFAVFIDRDGRVLLQPDVVMGLLPPYTHFPPFEQTAEKGRFVELGGVRYRAETAKRRGDESLSACTVDQPCSALEWAHVSYLLEDAKIARWPLVVFVRIALVILTGAFGFSVFLAWFTSVRMTRQLDDLVSATGTLARGENVEPLARTTENEIGLLARHFNSMAGTLARNRKTLEQHASRLEETNRRLRELDEAKTRLLTNVSHEMRTPVAAMISAAKIIHKYHTQKPEAVGRFSETIMKEGRRLAKLVEEALDLGRVESADPRWNDREQDAYALLEGAIGPLRQAAESKGIQLLTIIDDGIPTLVVDRDRVAQVIEHLVGNAIKFTPEGGTVTVRVRLGEKDLRFEVRDTGIGIPADQLDKIFERFYQVQDADSSREKPTGAGLGLTIAQNIVARYGSRISVTSAEGEGSVFCFTLPLDAADRAIHNETFAAGL